MSRAINFVGRWMIYLLAGNQMADAIVHQFAYDLTQPWRAILTLIALVVSTGAASLVCSPGARMGAKTSS